MSIGHKLCKSNRCPGSGGWKLGHSDGATLRARCHRASSVRAPRVSCAVCQLTNNGAAGNCGADARHYMLIPRYSAGTSCDTGNGNT